MKEFDFIQSLKNNFPESCIGDDAAIKKNQENLYTVVTKDLFIEHIHFSRRYMSLYEIARKSVLVNVSDIAAMAGTPKEAYLGIAIPKSYTDENLAELIEGFSDTFNDYNIVLQGGDTTSSASDLFISITLTGITTLPPLVRSNAKPGDITCTTGPLGLSSAGLWYLQNNLPISEKLKQAHVNPVPRINEAKLLRSCGVCCGMDISDGIVGDIKHILKQSNCGAKIALEKIYIDPLVKEAAIKAKKTPWDFILSGGEDYELVVTIPQNLLATTASRYTLEFGRELLVIGKITEKEFQIYDATGKDVSKLYAGFEHT